VLLLVVVVVVVVLLLLLLLLLLSILPPTRARMDCVMTENFLPLVKKFGHFNK